MWRPTDWRDIQSALIEKAYTDWNEGKAKKETDLGVVGDISEASADAILEALRQKSERVPIIIDSDPPLLIRSEAIVRGQPGFIVFVPYGHDPDTIEGMRQIANESLDRIEKGLQ